MADATLRRFDETRWRNWHRSVETSIRARFEIHNPNEQPTIAGMRKTAAKLQELIGEARRQRMRLTPIGANWSFSAIAAPVDGWALDTATANWSFRVGQRSVSPNYRGDIDELFFVQAGASIFETNRWLEPELRRSLRTSGASNGQTFTGAMSTGTHGSAIDIGAIQSQVVGLQLLTGDRSLWLERAGQPVVSADFADRLGAEIVSDDLLFEAALVGLGAVGVIHGLMLTTTGRFLLEASQARMPYDAGLQRAMNTLDFTGLALPDPTSRPYFFQVVVNPHSDEPVAYVKTMYKRACPPDYTPDYRTQNGSTGAGYDTPGLVGALLDALPSLTAALTTQIVRDQLKEFSGRRGTWGETFDFTTPRAETAGAALAVPARYATRAVALCREAFDAAGGAPLVFACRYVQRSPGLLAFTRFDPTCVIDLDGLMSDRTLAVMEAARQRFEAAGLPYAQHWGKLQQLTPERLRASYGGNVDRWIEARRRLLPDPELRAVFSRPLLDGLGLGS